MCGTVKRIRTEVALIATMSTFSSWSPKPRDQITGVFVKRWRNARTLDVGVVAYDVGAHDRILWRHHRQTPTLGSRLQVLVGDRLTASGLAHHMHDATGQLALASSLDPGVRLVPLLTQPVSSAVVDAVSFCKSI